MENNIGDRKEEIREEIIEAKNFEKKEVIINKYYKGKFLGKGGFGECYEFDSEDDGQKYAGKIINKNKFNEKNQKIKEKMKLETKIQQSLNSPKVVKVKTFFEDKKNVYIILELCKNHSLHDLIKRRNGPLTEIEVQNYIFQLIQGLRYLHSKKIIHRDLKPENLFLDEKLELKIGDFGLISQLTFEKEKRKTICGTTYYMAPELINPGKEGYSFEVDIWAIGVIMYYLLTKKYPFMGSDDKETMNLILFGNFYFPEDIKISESAKDLINQILVKEPKKRPNLNQILYHDFFHKNIFPKFLNVSTIVERPTLEEIREYIPKADENGIINKEIKTTNLYQLKIPVINDIKYENIDDYTLKEYKGYDNWILFFHKSSHFNFYYYEINNGLIGLYYDDKKNLVVDIKNNLFYYINIKNEDDEEKGGKDEIEKYEIKDCPEHLKDKLNIFLKYYEIATKKINKNNDDIISQKYINNDKEKELNYRKYYLNFQEFDEEINLFYIKKVDVKDKAYFLKLSDETKQVIFKDKIEILISEKRKTMVYFDKNKKQIILPTFDILNNSDKSLVKKMKYIRNYFTEEIKAKVKKKINKMYSKDNIR